MVMADLSFTKVACASTADSLIVDAEISLRTLLAFDVDVSLDLRDASGNLVAHSQLSTGGWDVSWLPQGSYTVRALSAQSDVPAGHYFVELALWSREADEISKLDSSCVALQIGATARTGPLTFAWHLASCGSTPKVSELSWRKGAGDWFYKHFDHAARTTCSYMLGDSPLLRGRILDVGCGDGITDLGIALRWRPELLVGIDPFRGYERLPQIMESARLPLRELPACLRFQPDSANALPFPDDDFDVVVSWGSLEHIAGGYAQALREIRRVLRPGGLLMVHPGLFYSDIGNHLGEFAFAREEPYVHLKRSREWLRERIMASEPDRMDRCGDTATSAEYWRWFTELNQITVGGFEKELRDLDFEPWRVALRTHDRVEYTPALQGYSFVDLAAGELYVSAYNRKPANGGESGSSR
jgi:SAM-dependent methyltransferase